MSPETITLQELIRVACRIEIRSAQLTKLYKDAEDGKTSPKMASSQANVLLSRIEDIAAEAQRP